MRLFPRVQHNDIYKPYFPTRPVVHRRTIGSSILLLLCALCARASFAASNDAPAPSAMDEKMHACTTCHGAQGQGRNNDYFPRIAGKPAEYLFNQLTAFRDGGRTYPPMGYLLAFLPDEYLRKISQYFADLQPPYPNPDTNPVPQATLDYGKQVVMQGDTKRGIPACAACHGEQGQGNPQAGAPRLTDKIWLYGGDRATIIRTISYSRGGVMPNWGARLDDETIKELAVYVHSLGGGK